MPQGISGTQSIFLFIPHVEQQLLLFMINHCSRSGDSSPQTLIHCHGQPTVGRLHWAPLKVNGPIAVSLGIPLLGTQISRLKEPKVLGMESKRLLVNYTG